MEIFSTQGYLANNFCGNMIIYVYKQAVIFARIMEIWEGAINMNKFNYFFIIRGEGQ